MLEMGSLTQDCIDDIVIIEQLCFTHPWSRASFEKELKNPAAHYAVLKDGGVVLGYGGFWAVLDEGHITNIAVHPLNQKMGLGSMILKDLIRQGEGLKLRFLTLEVRRGNAPAIALYGKYGFKNVGMRQNYYSEPTEDALLMTKYL